MEDVVAFGPPSNFAAGKHELAYIRYGCDWFYLDFQGSLRREGPLYARINTVGLVEDALYQSDDQEMHGSVAHAHSQPAPARGQ